MPFIKVEVYSIWKEWFLPFGRERNNWCETVSWAWLAHNLGTEGEKVFRTIPQSNYYIPPKKVTNISDSIQNVHLISCFHLKRNVNLQWSLAFSNREKWWMWLVSSPLITNLLGKKWNNESLNYRNSCWSLAFCDGEKSGRFPFEIRSQVAP